MANGKESVRGPRQEPDTDQVDFTWLTNGLRRLRLLGPPRPPRPLRAPRRHGLQADEQLDLFESDAVPAHRCAWRPPWFGQPGRSSGEQLALFGPDVVAPRRRTWRPAWALGSDAATVEDSVPSTIMSDPRARLLLAAAVIGYIVVFLKWTFRQQDGLGTQAFDIGVFDQGVWLLSQFKRPFVTVNGRNLFGDHTSFILLPWAIVYRFIPSIKVLLAGQTLALGLGAVPTFLIARNKLRSEILAAFLAVAYLVNPVLGWTNLSESFHPDAFEIPLVLFAFWFLTTHRWVGYWICVVALLLVKEDVALLTFALGVYVAIKHDKRIGLITCGVSAAWFVAAFWLIIPGFLGSGTVYSGRIPYRGPIGFVKKSLTHPGTVLSDVFTQPKAWYLWQLFAPLGFVAWFAPSVLLVALGPLLINVISGFGYQFDIRYHYSTLILPVVVVVATIFGVASAPRRDHRAMVGVVAAAALVCAYLWSPTPIGRVHPYIADPGSSAVTSFHKAERFLPADAVVSAYYGFIPQIAHRDEVYMFPNPWKASYWGTFKQEGQRLSQADRVQYIFVRSSLDPEPKAVFDSIVDEFEVVYHDDEVQLLRRRV